MGGYGSGRPREKTTVEECKILSLGGLKYTGAFRNGVNIEHNLVWNNTLTGKTTFSIDYELDTRDPTDAWMRLHHRPRCRGDALDYLVRLTTTPMPWGGVHWWFACPMSVNGHPCQRRCWKLYLPPGSQYFGCRSCHNLTYASSQEAHAFDAIHGLVAAQLGVPLSVLECRMKMLSRALGCDE